MLSLAGEIRYFVAGQENVVRDTQRLLRDSNAAGNAMIREGQKERESNFRQGIQEIENIGFKAEELRDEIKTLEGQDTITENIFGNLFGNVKG